MKESSKQNTKLIGETGQGDFGKAKTEEEFKQILEDDVKTKI